MSALEPADETELVVADDGSIPVDQVAGSLPDFPDIDWDDFERASELARQDLAPS
jgi:hypothetical protein